MSRKTENEKNAGSSVNDLESLATSLFEVYNGFIRKIFKRCPICGGKILYTEYPLKKSINEKNYKKIKIFYCKHCENKEKVVKKYFNKIQKG